MDGDFEGEDIYGTYAEGEEGEVEDTNPTEAEGEAQEVFGEEMEETAVAMEEGEFTASFEQMQNLRYRDTTGEVVEGISKGLQRAMRTPEENAISQMQIFLTDSRFDSLHDSRKEAIVQFAEKLKNLPLLSTQIISFAALFKLEKHALDRKELQHFSAKYKIPAENHVDLIRYLRLLGA
jgi:hypothetical protein